MRARMFAWIMSCSCLAACDEPLSPVELVTGVRVLGARAEVAGDPGRASPRAGESVGVRFLVASPEPDPPLSWALGACVGAASVSGLGACLEPPFATTLQRQRVPSVPALAFTVPTVDSISEVVVFGAVCGDGEVLETADGWSCPGSDFGSRVSLSLAIGTENRHPSLEAESIFLDGAIWPALVLDAPCQPLLKAGSRHVLSIRISADDRDALEQQTEIDPAYERLTLTHVTTDGDLERPFSLLEPQALPDALDVSWTAPARSELLPVRFWFVLRDGRGGADFVERSVCVEP
jgi:hypothetical protein